MCSPRFHAVAVRGRAAQRACALATILPAILGARPAAGQPQFVFKTNDAGLGNPPPQAGGSYLPGVQAADVNGDGWVDLFVPIRMNGQPDRLYINNGDKTFTEAAAAWGVADTSPTHNALFFDIDNDGLLDLVLANLAGDNNALRLLRRRADAPVYEDITAGSGLDIVFPGPQRPYGLSAVDLDGDGHLDLFLAMNADTLTATDYFFRNLGNGTFVEAREAAGVSGLSRSFQFHSGDLDLDGRIDLFLSQDTDALSRLYRGLGGWSVVDIAEESGISERGPDMGTSIQDYDNDGDFDIYITDITPSCPGGCGGWGLNRFYRNELIPSGTFSLVNIGSWNGAGDTAYGWGCTFFDYDNDGWLDLAGAAMNSTSRLFRNLGDGTYQWGMGPLTGFTPNVVGGGLIAFDYDRDGDRDIVLMGRDLPPLLYENEGGSQNNWLYVDPVYHIRYREAIGAQVRVTTGAMTQLRQITAGTSFISQEPDLAHFGLGTATQADRVHIRWPDGSWQEHFNVPANQYFSFHRVQGDFDWDGVVGGAFDVATFVDVMLGHIATSNELLRADMNFDGLVDGDDLPGFVSALIGGD